MALKIRIRRNLLIKKTVVIKSKVLAKIKTTPNTEATIKNRVRALKIVLRTLIIEISSQKTGNIRLRKRELNQKILKEITVLRIKTVKAKNIKTVIRVVKLMLRGN